MEAPESECSFDCPGLDGNKCGADNRLNVYNYEFDETPRTYTSLGCRSEPSSGRALAAKQFNDNLMTIEKCADGCAGFKYFGLEYYHEVSPQNTTVFG